MKKVFAFVVVFAILAGMVACSPPATPEPTPLPPTATPVIYNFALTVNNSEAAPVANAAVKVNGEPLVTDTEGTLKVAGLTTPSVVIEITASGYKVLSKEQSLTPGDNTAELTLEEDPAGLLVENACNPDEKLLYIDDFQDREAEGWDQVESGGPSWLVEEDPANPENFAIAARKDTTWSWLGARDDHKFNNAVWRIKFKLVGKGNMQLNFRFVESSSENNRYIIAAGNGGLSLGRLDQSNQHLDLGHAELSNMDRWHLLEFGYFDDQVTVLLDGKEKFSWKDPNPWQGGTVNLEPWAEEDSVFYYDDISVCELSAPVQPIPRAKTGRNLTVAVAAEDGTPIPNSPVTIAELTGTEEAEKMTDEAGTTSWVDLPGSAVTVMVSAPGYFGAEQTIQIQKGENSGEVELKRDANSKLFSEVCNTGEALLYYEDIQDKNLLDWPDVNDAVAMGAPAISIVEDPDQAGNLILKLQRMGEQSNTGGNNLQKGPFGDAVLRFRAKATGSVHYLIGWHNNYGYEFNGETIDLAQYLAFIYANQDMGGRVEKVFNKPGDRTGVPVINWQKYLGDGKWHNYEILTYQGEYQIWADGKMLGKWLDPNPIPEGYVSIANDFWKPDSSAVYDDFTVCSLSAPFVSLYVKK
ncbi:MAG: carboxypeptidase-like regulatory domain-containing protein [Anaerolineaceae bacterium]